MAEGVVRAMITSGRPGSVLATDEIVSPFQGETLESVEAWWIDALISCNPTIKRDGSASACPFLRLSVPILRPFRIHLGV